MIGLEKFLYAVLTSGIIRRVPLLSISRARLILSTGLGCSARVENDDFHGLPRYKTGPI